MSSLTLVAPQVETEEQAVASTTFLLYHDVDEPGSMPAPARNPTAVTDISNVDQQARVAECVPAEAEEDLPPLKVWVEAPPDEELEDALKVEEVLAHEGYEAKILFKAFLLRAKQ